MLLQARDRGKISIVMLNFWPGASGLCARRCPEENGARKQFSSKVRARPDCHGPSPMELRLPSGYALLSAARTLPDADPESFCFSARIASRFATAPRYCWSTMLRTGAGRFFSSALS